MGSTYTRQSSTEIVDGEVIQAADFNNEFSQLVSAFAASTGHTHDGTSAEGGPVTKLLGTAITIGDGSSGTDIAVTFDGETTDGLLTWMEDEDHFKFSDDVVLDSSKRLYLYDEGGEYIYGDGTYLYLVSGADINIPANIGMTFGNDGEKIEGDGTDLTISGNNINLTATADVNVPSGVGITFATTEKIESDGTDLSVTVGSGGDINIPADIGVTFGNDGEKIEGDGTDLTITGNNINLTATADVVIPADIGITFGTGEKIEGNNTDITVTSGADINLTATSDVNIPSGVGVTFGDDGEKIEGDGTDLTISGNNINLTATADVNIPSGVGVTFATTEKIESDGTDLSITVGSNGDINIPADIGLTFGDDGEKIEGDGTDLTISASALANIDAGTDIVLDAGGGDIFFKDDGTTFGSATNTSGDLIIKSGTTTAMTFSGANVTFAGTVTIGSAGISEAELEILDGASVTTTELNLIDGDTARGTTSVASGDGILINDGGTMRMTNVDTVSTYFASHSVGGGNIVTTGALDSGSITSGFGAIDNGTSGIRTDTFTAETSIVPDASGGADIGTASLEWGDVYIADDKYIQFGSDQNILVGYDENGNDTLEVKALSGAALGLTFSADAAEDNADTWKLNFADGGDITLQSYTSGSFATKLTLDTGGDLTVAGDLTVSGDDLFMATNTDGYILVADGTNYNPVAVSGDISLSNTGAAAIASGVIVNADINGSAAIADSKLDTITTANKVGLAALDIDGGTDIGEAIVDADLFIIDNGAGGTNRKVTASRLKTYAGAATLAGIDDQTSSNDDQLTITDTAIIINEDSDDLDFRVESNGNANMFTVNGGSDLVGVGSDPDLGVGLHIKSADSGASVAGGADELVVEGSGHAGITVASGATSGASLLFANSSGTGRGGLAYYEADNNTYFYSGGTNVANLSDNGLFFLTDDGERVNGDMTTGLTINQGAADDVLFALKSSDVAHGMTGRIETDTFYAIKKAAGASGGAFVEAWTEANANALLTRAITTSENTTDASDSEATIAFDARIADSTNYQAMGSTGNMFLISNANAVKVLFKGDGTIHAADTSWATSLDTEDDIMALRMLDKSVSTKGVINSAWDDMIGTDWEYLQNIGVAGSTNKEKGRPDMFSMQGTVKLNMGATWYLAQNFMAFVEAMDKKMPGIKKAYEDTMVEQSGRAPMLQAN